MTMKASLAMTKIGPNFTLKPLYLNWALAVIIFLAGFVVYIHTLNSSFHFDDEGTIIDNSYIHRPSNVFNSYNERPVLTFTFALNYYFGKLNPFGYHLVNTILHSLCGILVFFLILLSLKLPSASQRLKDHARRIAFYTALIFVTHPIRPESVIYISSRSEVLCTFFYLSAVISFILAAQKQNFKKIFLALTILFTFLGIGTKEIAATIPFIILLYDYLFISNGSLNEIKKKWLFYCPLFSLLLYSAYLIITGYAHKAYGLTSGFGIQAISPIEYLFTQFTVVLYYLRLLIFPDKFQLDYDWPYAKSLFEFPAFFSFLIIAGIALLVKRLWRSKPLYAFWIIWYFLTPAPESSIVPLNDVIFLHRTYLPSLGPILLFVIGIDAIFDYLKIKLAETAFFALIIAILGILTVQQGNIWQNELLLWKDAVKNAPKKSRPHNNLGMAYKNSQLNDKALAEFKESFRVNPNYARGRVNLGALYYELKFPDKALEELKSALAIDPGLAEGHMNIGLIYSFKGEYEKAINSFKTAIAVKPNYIEPYYNLGSLYIKVDNISAAIDTYLKAIRVDPEANKLLANLGALYAKKNMFNQAQEVLVKAIGINPKDTFARYNLALTYERLGWPEKAIAEYQEALKINPKFSQARNSLLAILEQQGRFDEAVTEYQYLVSRNPMDGNLMTNFLFLKMKKEKFNKAKEAFEESLKKKPNDQNAFIQFGKSCLELKIYRQAESIFQQLITFAPSSFEARLNLGIIYGEEKFPERAIAEFKKAIGLSPDNPKAHYNLGVTYEDNGIYALAIKEYRKTILCQANFKMAYLNLGNLLTKEQKLDEAEGCFKEAIKIDANFAEGYLNLGVIEMKQNQFAKAEENLKTALRLKSPYPLGHFNLAIVYLNEAKIDLADNEYTLLKSIDPRMAQELKKILPAQGTAP